MNLTPKSASLPEFLNVLYESPSMMAYLYNNQIQRDSKVSNSFVVEVEVVGLCCFPLLNIGRWDQQSRLLGQEASSLMKTLSHTKGSNEYSFTTQKE